MKAFFTLLTASLLLSCAGSGDGSTGYPFCDEGKQTQKSLLAMYQAYLSDPTLKMEFNMEKNRYDNQVAECKAESGKENLLPSTADLLCGEDAQCKGKFK